MSKINVVIPMAGAGSRFSKKGYKEAKPFIEFNGKMMIEHVLDGIAITDIKYNLIIRSEFEKQYEKQLDNLKSNYNISFFTVSKLTQGASCTVLSIHKVINNTNPLLIMDSDNIFQKGIISNFIDDAKDRSLDGSLLTFSSDIPAFSFVELNKEGLAVQVKEKEVISNNAICGAYYFKSGRDFVDTAINNIIYNESQKGEYYISGIYQQMVNENKKIGIYNIDKTEWDCVGTPEQLNNYLLSLR